MDHRFEDLLLSTIINIVEENKEIDGHIKDLGMTAPDFAKKIIYPETKSSVHLTTHEEYQAMSTSEYNSHWVNDNKHCIVYKSNLHRHCGIKIWNGHVCDKCKTTKVGKKLMEGDGMDLEKYKLKCDKSRIMIARSKLKKDNVIPLYLQVNNKQDRLLIDYKHSDTPYLYNKTTGLIVQSEGKDRDIKYLTVGMDKKNSGEIRKLTIKDINALNGTKVTVMMNTIDAKAAKYVKNKASK